MLILLLTLMVQCYMPVIWKLTALRKYDSRGILLLNYAVTVIVSAVISQKQNLFSVLYFLDESNVSTLMDEKTLPNTAFIVVVVGICAGAVYYLSLFSSQRNISVNGMGISSFFSQAGLVGSLIIAFLFFDEKISFFQGMATIGIVLSILVMTSDNEKIKIKSPALLMAVCIFNVGVGASNKFFAKYAVEAYKTVFLTIAFLVAFLMAGIKIMYDIHKKGKRLAVGKAEIVYGVTLGGANLLYSYLNLKCLQMLPAVVVIPTLSAGGLVVSTLIAILYFKEATSKRHIIAMLFSCICIIFLNM